SRASCALQVPLQAMGVGKIGQNATFAFQPGAASSCEGQDLFEVVDCLREAAENDAGEATASLCGDAHIGAAVVGRQGGDLLSVMLGEILLALAPRKVDIGDVCNLASDVIPVLAALQHSIEVRPCFVEAAEQ